MSRQIQITIVPREIGELWDELLQSILQDVCRKPVKGPLSHLISHAFKEHHNLHIGKCYQQYTPNFCGYHATFNSLCFLNAVTGSGTNFNIESASSFWSFKRTIEQFLFEFKAKYNMGQEWPWRTQDILYGDFERTYNKLCLQHFKQFDVFRSTQKFELHSFTWEFQYQNLIISEDKRQQLNRLIDYFQRYIGVKPLIISFMLAITNHWMCFIAIKTNNKTDYWFFDSFNRDILDHSEEQILQLVEQLDLERIKYKKNGFTPFFKQNIAMCMRDTQTTIKLLVDTLEGKATIEGYVYNQQFNIFANALQPFLMNQEQFDHTLKDYWHNIQGFFNRKVRLDLLSSENTARLISILRASEQMAAHQTQMAKFNTLVHRNGIKASL